MKPICVNCRCFYRPETNGVYFVEGMPIAPDAPRGLQAPELWKPYKLWSGDLWECPLCHQQIISGVGREPVTEHYQPDFGEMLRKIALATNQPVIQINDC